MKKILLILICASYSLSFAGSNTSRTIKEFENEAIIYRAPNYFKLYDSFSNEVIYRLEFNDNLNKNVKNGIIYVQRTENGSKFEHDSFQHGKCLSEFKSSILEEGSILTTDYIIRKIECSDPSKDKNREDYFVKSFYLNNNYYAVGFIPSDYFYQKNKDDLDSKSIKELNSLEILNVCRLDKTNKNKNKVNTKNKEC